MYTVHVYTTRSVALGDLFPWVEEEMSAPRMGGAVLSMVAALLLALAPVQEAQAAKSGGRIGGTASAARSKPPPRAPAASSSSKTGDFHTFLRVFDVFVVFFPPQRGPLWVLDA